MGILRFALAVAVLIVHSEPILGVTLMNGDTAVTSFFVISGFLITLILRTKYINATRIFFINRLLRIYPPYLFALIFSIVIFYFIPNGNHNPFSNVRSDDLHTIILSSISNISLIGANWVPFFSILREGGLIFPNFAFPGAIAYGAHNAIFVPQNWTLSIELMFYFLAPFVVRRRLWVPIAFLLLSIYFAELIQNYASDNTYRINDDSLFIAQLRFFLFGAIAVYIYEYLENHKFKLLQNRLFQFTSFITAGLALYFSEKILLLLGDYQELLYFYIALTLPGVISIKDRLGFINMLGNYSYPIYLLHYPVAKSLAKWLPVEFKGIFTLLVTILVSAIYLQIIEPQVTALRNNNIKKIIK